MIKSSLVDVVSRKDRVIAKINPKNPEKLKNKITRAVAVFVFDKKGRIFLQKMSKDSFKYPLHWNCSVCGFVESGESYEDAAVRGLMEDLGIAKRPGDLEYVSKELITNESAHFAKIFMAVHDGSMALSKEKIAEGKFLSMREVERMMSSRNERFSPFFRTVFERVFGSDEVKREKFKRLNNKALPGKRRSVLKKGHRSGL